MTAGRRFVRGSVLALVGLAAACGKKGPPLPPERPVPAGVADLTARRAGDTVWLTFTVPDRNQSGSQPADLARVDVYGLTVDPRGKEPTLREVLEHGTLVASVEVRPPAVPGAAAAAEEAADPRPAQGATVTVEEFLTADLSVPILPGGQRPGEPSTAAVTTPAPTVSSLVRTYVAIARSGRSRRFAPSGRAQVSLRPPPQPPEPLELTYSERAFTLRWPVPPDDPWQPLWPLFGYGWGVNVYELPREAGGGRPPRPLNAAPLGEGRFEVPLTAFGVPRCFSVRAVETVEGRPVESELAQPVCATPVDTFAPAAPSGLVAVAEPGAINLSWNPNAEPDLAGYVVLRGEAPGTTLRQITPAPIGETSYRDTDVRPGVRYVYAVVAVDRATPPNYSAQSARVEETAR